MSFLSTGLTGFSHATAVFLVAAALTLVFDAARLLDLGQAGLAGLAAALATRLPLDPAIGLVAIPLALAALGAALDLSLYRRLRRASPMAQLLVMLGLLVLFRDAAGLLLANPPAPGPGWSRASLDLGALHLPIATVPILVVGPILLGLLCLLPRHTPLWRRHLAVPSAAALSGLAGMLSTLVPRGASTGGALDLLTGALLAILLGGLGSLPGALLGAMIISLIQAFTAGLFPGAALALPVALTGAVLLVRPAGLFGRAVVMPSDPPAPLPIGPAPRSARLLFGIALALAAAAPLVAPDALPSLIGGALAILFAASLHVLVGPGGIPALGHAAWFGVGAYASAVFIGGGEVTLPLGAATLVVGAATAGLAAFLIGLVLARLSDPAVAMLTLVVAQLVWSVGPLSWPATPSAVPSFLTPTVGFWLVVAIGVGVALILRRMIYAPFGYALRATRDDPARAAASGLPIAALRLAAVTIAGGVAGLAGALTVITAGAGALAPALETSAGALLMLALGGVQAVAAPIVGALAIGVADLLPASPWWPLLLGPALVAIPLLLPEGIAGASIRFWRRAL